MVWISRDGLDEMLPARRLQRDFAVDRASWIMQNAERKKKRLLRIAFID